jgi:hypothetical protein
MTNRIRKLILSESRKNAEAKAREIWKAMTDSERHGVRFGLFPHEKMEAATREGFDGKLLATALMDCAEKDGGMRA